MFIVSEGWVRKDGILCSNAKVFKDKESSVEYIKNVILSLLNIDYSDWKEEDFDIYIYEHDGIKYAWNIIEVKGKLVEE